MNTTIPGAAGKGARRAARLHRAAAIACAAALAACGNVGEYKSFAYDLQGTWESTKPEFAGEGTLVIKSDSIRISGYNAWWYPAADEAKRPFTGFTKDASLEGYAEATDKDYPGHSGTFFIKDWGEWKEVHYQYQRTGGSYSEYEYFLKFTFGGRDEILKKTAEDAD